MAVLPVLAVALPVDAGEAEPGALTEGEALGGAEAEPGTLAEGEPLSRAEVEPCALAEGQPLLDDEAPPLPLATAALAVAGLPLGDCVPPRAAVPLAHPLPVPLPDAVAPGGLFEGGADCDEEKV